LDGAYGVPVNKPDRVFADLVTVGGVKTDILFTDEVLRTHTTLTAACFDACYPKSVGVGDQVVAQTDTQNICRCVVPVDGTVDVIADSPRALVDALAILNENAAPHIINAKYTKTAKWMVVALECCDVDGAPPGRLPVDSECCTEPPVLTVYVSHEQQTTQSYLVALIHLSCHMGHECFNHDEHWRAQVMRVVNRCCQVLGGLPATDSPILAWVPYMSQIGENDWGGRTVAMRVYEEDTDTLGFYNATGIAVMIEVNTTALSSLVSGDSSSCNGDLSLLQMLVFLHELVHVVYPRHLHGPVFQDCFDAVCATCFVPRTRDGGRAIVADQNQYCHTIPVSRVVPALRDPLMSKGRSLQYQCGVFLARQAEAGHLSPRSSIMTSEGQLRFLALCFPLLVFPLSGDDVRILRGYVGSQPDNLRLVGRKAAGIQAAPVTIRWSLDSRIADTALGNLFPHIRVYCQMKGGKSAWKKRLELDIPVDVSCSECDTRYQSKWQVLEQRGSMELFFVSGKPPF
jgi:hypothetical protein